MKNHFKLFDLTDRSTFTDLENGEQYVRGRDDVIIDNQIECVNTRTYESELIPNKTVLVNELNCTILNNYVLSYEEISTHLRDLEELKKAYLFKYAAIISFNGSTNSHLIYGDDFTDAIISFLKSDESDGVVFNNKQRIIQMHFQANNF